VFFYTGDTWDLKVMQHVMLLGMAIAVIPTVLLFFFNDDNALGTESDSLRRIIQEQKRRRIQEQRDQQGIRQPLLGGRRSSGLRGREEVTRGRVRSRDRDL
jgi:hypothetical protein